jgi:hypothetical protein
MFRTSARWFRRARGAAPLRKPRRPILELQRLEERDCPALLVWIGHPDGSSGDWADGANWQNRADGSTGAAPTSADDTLFGVGGPGPSQGANQSHCYYYGTSGDPAQPVANSITVDPYYQGKLHFQSSNPVVVGPGGVGLEAAEIVQDTGQDIIDQGDFNWSGGDLNVNSPFLADFKVAAGGRVSISGDDKQSGTTLNLQNRALATLNLTMGNLKLTFVKNAGIKIDATSTLNWIDGNIAANAGSTGEITNAGNFYKSPGVQAITTDALPIENTGTFQLQDGTLNLTGSDPLGRSYDQQSGTTDLWNGCILRIAGDLHQSGGNFWTEGNQPINILGTGNVIFDGGFINFNHNQQGGLTGSLFVSNTTKIQGNAEWDCKVDCSSRAIDVLSTKDFWSGNVSTFKAVPLNIPAGGVPGMQQWNFLSYSNTATVNFRTYVLDFNDGSGGSWARPRNNPVLKTWYISS